MEKEPNHLQALRASDGVMKGKARGDSQRA